MAIKTPDQLSALSSPATGDLVSLWDINEVASEKMKRTTVTQLFASQSGTTGLAVFADETAADARTTLGVAIGSDVQAYDAGLDDLAGLAVTDGNIIVGDGANWVAESGATARTSLGLAIGTDVQAYDAGLDDLAGLAVTDGNFIVGDGVNWVVESGATARTSLGLGTMAVETATDYLALAGGSMAGNISFASATGITFPGNNKIIDNANNLTIQHSAADVMTFTVGAISSDVDHTMKGQLTIADGATSGPYGIGFSDPDCGIWLEGPDAIAIEAGGNISLSVNSAGIEVLGDTDTDTLTVSGDATLSAGFLELGEIAQPATAPANTGRLYVADDGGISNLYFMRDNGVPVDLTAAGSPPPALTNWEEDGTTFQPVSSGYSIGSSGNEVGSLVMGSSSEINGGVSFVDATADFIKIRMDGDIFNQIVMGKSGSDEGLNITGPGYYGWHSNTAPTGLSGADVRLYRDATGILAQRNSTSSQEWRLYNTWTDASNGEWFEIGFQDTSNTCVIKTNSNAVGVEGDGTERDIVIEAPNLTVQSTPIATDPVRGALYVDTTLTNTANGTPAKVLGAGSTTSITLNDVDENAVEQRLRYTGTTTAWFRVSASVSCTHTVNNTVISFSFAKNGTNDANTTVDRKVGTGGDIGGVHLETVIQLATNDYIEVFSDADNAGTTSMTAGVITMTPIF